MSNCPFFIRPEFIDEVAVRIKERRLISNYFVPGVLNVVTGMSRTPETGNTVIMNIIQGTNPQYQIVPLPSDPLYVDKVENSLEANKLSILYSLDCLKGLEVLNNHTVNIVTPSERTFVKWIEIFELVMNNKNDFHKLNRYRRELSNYKDLVLFDILRNINLMINLIHIKKIKNNPNDALQVFLHLNKKIPLTEFDLFMFEGMMSGLYNFLDNLNKHRLKEVDYYQ